MQGKIKCTNCDNMIPIGAPYCIFCGVKQTAQNVLQEGGKRRRKRQTEVPIVRAGTDVMVPVKVIESSEPERVHDSVTLHDSSESLREDKTIIKNLRSVDVPAADIGIQRTQLQEESVSGEGDIRTEDSDCLEARDTAETEAHANKEKRSLAARMKDKRDEKEYEYRQAHDELTDLFNKSFYDERMKDMDMNNVCIIVMDMKGLEKINRMYGKADGDLALISVAQVLRLIFGNNCYRMQSGEYCVVLNQINENAVISRIESFHYELRKKEKELRETGKQLDIKMAVGYLYGVSGQNAADVYEKARDYMQEEKRRMEQIYDPNYDGYYNDVKVEHEDARVEIDRENIHKAVIVVLAAVVFLIFYYVFLV